MEQNNIDDLSSLDLPKIDIAGNRFAQRIKNETNANIEFKKGILEITINFSDRSIVMPEIVRILGPHTIYRVFNSAFVDDVIEFGTDKALVDAYDFRRLTPFNGLDVWGVEKIGIEKGLKRSDVLCANPYFIVARDGSFESDGLGIPNDRSAIVVYKEDKLEEIPNTDGYYFKDPENKKDAVLAVIKINEVSTELEIKINSAQSLEQKISILNDEVSGNIKSHEDLVKCPYVYFNIIRILRDLSRDPKIYNENHINIEKLINIANKASEITRSIYFKYEMTHQLAITRDAFAQQHGPKMRAVTGWPDFVIQTITEHLQSSAVESGDREELLKIIEDAKLLKKELNI